MARLNPLVCLPRPRTLTLMGVVLPFFRRERCQYLPHHLLPAPLLHQPERPHLPLLQGRTSPRPQSLLDVLPTVYLELPSLATKHLFLG